MSRVAPLGEEQAAGRTLRLSPDLLLAAGALLFLAAPLLVRLASGPWRTSDQGAAPIVLLMAAGMAIAIRWREDAPAPRPALSGFGLLAAGLLLFLAASLVGNMFGAFVGALLAMGGTIVALRGWPTLRQYRLPLLATAFAAPLPGAVVTSLTFPLKMLISRMATALMLAAGLPAARLGVMIDVGDYRLLVADACSGLQSIYTLMAIAVLVLFLRGTARTGATVLTILAAIPIVCVLNALRIFAIGVMAYEDGLWLADGPAHAAAGALMYVAAFFALLGFARLMEAAWR